MRRRNRISRADKTAREDLQRLPECCGEDRQAQESARVGRIGRQASCKDRGYDEVDRLDRDLLHREAQCGRGRGNIFQPVNQTLRRSNRPVEAAGEEPAFGLCGHGCCLFLELSARVYREGTSALRAARRFPASACSPCAADRPSLS
jgi:hypothetical protein